MPEFIPILLVAVLLLLVLFIGFGMLAAPEAYRPVEMRREITLGEDFTVSYRPPEQEVASLEGTVSKGLISQVDKSISFDVLELEGISSAKINLKVQNTNLYGPLIIYINNNEIYNGYARIGDHSIYFNKDYLQTSNALDIQAESSGWKFWAPTMYIFNAKVSVNYKGSGGQVFHFYLNESEMKNIDRPELTIIIQRRNGRGLLTATVNGKNVYRDFVNKGEFFSKDYLKLGENIVALSTEPDTSFDVRSAEIVLWS